MIVVPSGMGHLNKRALLSHLWRMGMTSRSELARSLGLSQPTAGKIVDELLELGVCEEIDGGAFAGECGRPGLKAGRPARMLRLNTSKPHFLLIQLGVDHVCFSEASLGVHHDDTWTLQFETPKSADLLVALFKKIAGKFKHRRYWGVVVSVPGVVDERAAKVIYSPNLHWTEAAVLPEIVREVWSAPIILVQEEHALALGHLALNRQSEDFFLADFGDGVGGAVVMAGKLFNNSSTISGEFGHTVVRGNSRKCGCGATGCLETLMSRRGLLQSFAAANPKIVRPTWELLAQRVAKSGLEPWLIETIDATGEIIAGALNVTGLRRIVITGSINELGRPVLEQFSKAVSRSALWARFGEVEVISAPRHRVAGLVAAGLDRLILPLHKDTTSKTATTSAVTS